MKQGFLVAQCVALEVDLVYIRVHTYTVGLRLQGTAQLYVKMSTTEMFNQPFKHYLVLDFESTCQEGVRIDPQEIIEFPCLLVGADDLCLVDQVP